MKSAWEISLSGVPDSKADTAPRHVTRKRPGPLQPTIRLPLAPSLGRRRLQVYLVLLLADAVAIVAGFMLAGYLYLGDWLNSAVLLEAQLLVPVYWTTAIANNAYSAGTALDVRIGMVRTSLALLVAAGIVVFLAYFLKTSGTFSRVISALGTVLSLVLLAIGRDQGVRFAHWRCGPTAMNVVVVSDGGAAVRLPYAYQIDAREQSLVPDIDDPHALDRIALYLANMDRVIVVSEGERRAQWAMALKGIGIQAEIVYNELAALGAIGARSTPEYSSLVIAIGPLGLRSRAVKRGFDLVLSLGGLIALLPLLLVIALSIKLEDRGSILFVQRRLGRGNRLFSIYKFRSMRIHHADYEGANLVTRDDARVTRVGRLIRATSIDELPQLLNVLKGEMSLVGPRPHALGSQAGKKLYWEVDRRYWQRHSLKPGLTGLAQVRGLRGATDHEADLINRLQADLEYLDGWTIWRDIAILLGTVRVLAHRNAF